MNSTPDNAKNPGTHDNLIHHNIACSATSTGSIALGGNSNNNSIHDNFATSISVFGKVNKVNNNTTQLVIVNNGSGQHAQRQHGRPQYLLHP